MANETSALRLSAYATAFFGVLGTIFGLWIHSSAILLDGVFNWISFVMALVSIKVAGMVQRPADDAFPFGYAGFEPLVNTVKSLLILGVSVYAVFGAVRTILAGGQDLEAGFGIVYAAIAVGGCLTVAIYQRGVAQQSGSPLVAVDAKNWFINGAISSSVGLAFVAVIFLRGGSWDAIVPYVDSGLVVLIVLLTLPVPLKMAKENLGELLGYAPPEDVQHAVHERVEELVRDTPVRDFELRATAVGRTLFLLAETHVAGDQTVAGLDGLRKKLCEGVRDLHPHLVMDVVFRPS
ncbi:MAG: cation diffusion facilitator family transporter [Planctomycetota bacterium]|jgi:cation diffusion facilitator family transporter